MRRVLGLADGDYVVGMCAVFRPEKNHLQLVEAVAKLRARGIPARALLIGDGPMRPAIESRARDLGVAADVVIAGFHQDVRPLLAASDVVALPSTSVETFSLAALEAMALARPVVLSDIPRTTRPRWSRASPPSPSRRRASAWAPRRAPPWKRASRSARWWTDMKDCSSNSF
jgi:glycosyltransferase involved in cell wall biosynthesis